MSIQGLVLVAEPYYNEAGYEKQVGSAEGAKNSRLYSESTFLLCCRSALALLRRPPPPFGPLVRAHYREARARLLGACEQYLDGGVALGRAVEAGTEVGSELGGVPPAGPSTGPADAPEDRPAPPPSEGFRLMLRQLLPRLREGLDALGDPPAACEGGGGGA